MGMKWYLKENVYTEKLLKIYKYIGYYYWNFLLNLSDIQEAMNSILETMVGDHVMRWTATEFLILLSFMT